MAELVQRIVDGGERNRHAGALGFLEKRLGRQVAIAAGEEQPAQSDALARRAQAHRAQAVFQIVHRAAGKARGGAIGRRAEGGGSQTWTLGNCVIHAP